MAMRDVVGPGALVDTQLAADLLAIGWSPGLNSALGAWDQYLNLGPPKVIWTPTTDRFDGALPSYPPATAAKMPWSCKTCWMGFDARLWAAYTNLPVSGYFLNRPGTEDFAAIEVLRDQLIIALHKILSPKGYELGQGYVQNMSGSRGGAEELELGRAYVLPVSIARPVVDYSTIGNKQTLVTVPMSSRSLGNVTES